MDVSSFLEHTNDALRGGDEDAPNLGTPEGNRWLRTLNYVISELYEDTNVLWNETWAVRSLGVVTAGATPTFDAADDLIAPSDQVYITDTDSKNHYYDLTKPRRRQITGPREFYLAGMNPQVLYSSNEITADEDVVGGTLYLPGYYKPAEINVATEDGSTILPFLDPYYAVMATAAELAFNDLTYEDKAGDLAGKANMLRRKMVRKNRRNTYNTPHGLPRNVRKIRDTETY